MTPHASGADGNSSGKPQLEFAVPVGSRILDEVHVIVTGHCLGVDGQLDWMSMLGL